MNVRDHAQFGHLIEEALPSLRRIVAQRMDPALAAKRDADDILQDACARAQQRWLEFQASGMRFFPWLYRIVLDCMFDDRDHHLRLRRTVKLEEGWPDHSSVQMVKGLASPETSLSQAVVQDEQLNRLRQRTAETLAAAQPEMGVVKRRIGRGRCAAGLLWPAQCVS